VGVSAEPIDPERVKLEKTAGPCRLLVVPQENQALHLTRSPLCALKWHKCLVPAAKLTILKPVATTDSRHGRLDFA